MKTARLTAVWLASALAPMAFGQDISYRHIEKGVYSVFEDGITPRARVRANFYVKKDGDPWAA